MAEENVTVTTAVVPPAKGSNQEPVLVTQVNTGAAVVDSIKLLGGMSFMKAIILPLSLALSLGLYMNFNRVLDMFARAMENAAAARTDRVHATALSDSVVRGRQTKALLSTLQVQFKASRATAWLFHNGTESLTGVPFLKVDEIGEVAAPGISQELANNQNMPIDVISEWIPVLVKKDCLSTDLDHASGTLRGNMQRYGIEKILACPFFSRTHSEPLGYLALSYAKGWELPDTGTAYAALRSAAIAQGAVIDAYQDSVR